MSTLAFHALRLRSAQQLLLLTKWNSVQRALLLKPTEKVGVPSTVL